MRLLVVHQNLPGQFRHVAKAWSQRPGWQVIGVGRDTAPGLPGLEMLRYKPHREVRGDQHPYLRTMESAVLHGQAVLRLLQKLKRRGFVPDAVVAHPGWGETLYVKDIFPSAQLIHFCEWYYQADGADINFDPEYPATLDDEARIRTWNALHLLNLENCDIGVTPTQWQHSRHPKRYRDKIVVAHEGIDTARLGPDGNAAFVVPTGINRGKVLRAGDPVVTYVARNLEPYRGFPQFIRALERVQAKHKSCHAIIVGGDDVSYGRRPKDASNWREQLLQQVNLDPLRTHFVGRLPYEQYKQVLQVSAAHVYLTYPFVLSWSMLEAMASGALVIGSNTAPVLEVLKHQLNGLIVPFFDSAQIADRMLDALTSPQDYRSHRSEAATAAKHYSRSAGVSAFDYLLQRSESAVSLPWREVA